MTLSYNSPVSPSRYGAHSRDPSVLVKHAVGGSLRLAMLNQTCQNALDTLGRGCLLLFFLLVQDVLFLPWT